MWEGVLYNIIFTEYPFKRVTDDVTAFHRILWNAVTSLGENKVIYYPPPPYFILWNAVTSLGENKVI